MDKEYFINLYCKCFNDTTDFALNLFENEYRNIAYISENGVPVSMLFLIDVTLNGAKGKYIYAACTDTKYRKKGYMSRLLKKVIDEQKSKSDFLLLYPANGELRKYYKKFGFTDIPGFSENTVTLREYSGKTQTVTNADTYIKIRNKLADENTVLFGKDYAKFILSYSTSVTDSTENPSFLLTYDGEKIIECLGDKKGINAYKKYLGISFAKYRKQSTSGFKSMLLAFKEINVTEIYFGLTGD